MPEITSGVTFMYILMQTYVAEAKQQRTLNTVLFIEGVAVNKAYRDLTLARL